MRTMKRTLACATTLLLVMGLADTLAAKPLPHDSRILEGTLENGVTWKYRRHDNPPGKMWLMIRVDSGSLNETEDQRGLAHFIEHMCFNGTTHFAPGELIPYFESIGMEFGADLNAFTSFDQTVYMIFAPNTEVDQIGKALMVLSDYAFGALLPDKEIEKERGVVLEESRSGKSAFQRIRDKLWPELFEGSRFAKRLPIGDEEVISHAKRKEFSDYYQTWYRPENVTVFMVGDAAPDAYIPLIKKWFGQETPDAPARKQQGPAFQPFTRQRSMVVTDPELSSCNVQAYNMRPGRPPTLATEQWRTELVESIGSWIVNRRYDERVKKGEASFRGANAGVSNFFNDALMISASASGEPPDWAKMLEETIVELNRAREHGFTQRELDLARKEILAGAEHAVKTEPTQNARRIINQIVFAVNNRVPVLSAQQELDLYKEFLPSIDLDEVNAAFVKNFEPGTFAYVVTTPDKEGVTVPSRDEVLAAARSAWARKTKAPETGAVATDLLAKLPAAGKTVEKSFDKDLEITSGWLGNGVRFHHRFMDYKKDTIMISIALAGGAIEETAANVGITQVASLAIREAATSRLTSTQMRDLMTGKNIAVRGGGRGGSDTFDISVSGAPEDLEIGLQQAHALLTDGIIEASAFKNWKLQTLQQLDMMEKMPQFKGFEAMFDLVTGGDPRRPFLKKENVEALSREKAQAWFDRLRREAPIEVAVVGDMKQDDVMPLIERYIGSLPKRDRSAAYLNKLRTHPRSTGPLMRHVEVETMTPKAMSFAGFVSADGRDVPDTRAMDIAANVLSSRLVKRVREDLSIVYSIRASNSADQAYRDSSLFLTAAPCDPDNAQKVVDEAKTIFEAFAKEGPSAEELENAQKQIANNLDTQMREPRYWLSILQNFTFHEMRLEDQKNQKEAYNNYTAKQVQAVFKKYYTPRREFSVTAVPVQAETGKEEEKEKAAAAVE